MTNPASLKRIQREVSGNPKWENLNKAILRLWGVHNCKNDFREARQVSWQLLIERLLELFNERWALLKTLNHSLRADSHLEAQVCGCTRTYWISWRGRPLFSEFSLFKTMVLKSTAFKTVVSKTLSLRHCLQDRCRLNLDKYCQSVALVRYMAGERVPDDCWKACDQTIER